MVKKITRRERVKLAVAHKETDYVPCAFDMTRIIQNQLCSHYRVEPADLNDLINEHMQYIGPGGPGETLPNGDYRDEFGTVWRWAEWMTQTTGDAGALITPGLGTPSLTGYSFPKPGKDRFKHVDPDDLKQSDRYVVMGLTALFDTCWRIRGFENFLCDMADDENFVNAIMDKATEYLVGIVEQTPDGVDAIRFLEDWGLQKGLMMGVKSWRKFLKPRLKIIYGAAIKKGITVMLHSCGDIHELFPDLIEIGMQLVHPMQPEVMDLAWVKKEYGKDLAFYGGMGCQSTLVYGSVADTIAEARHRIKTMAKGGGYILGPAGAISVDAKIENVIALVEFNQTGA